MSEAAERSCRAIMGVCADWETVAREIDRRDFMESNLLNDSDRLGIPESAQSLSYLARIVAHGESFTFARIRETVEAHVARVGSPMLTQLYDGKKNALDSTWDNALNALRDWLSVDLRKASSWPHMKSLIELRNASAHGGGGFTERQRKNPQQFEKMRKEISTLGYEFQSFRIITFRGAVRREARAVSAFVQEIDDLTRSTALS
ncbi:hypothetical protein [Streptomyces sp. YIM 132580]|uniref:hypothetical protein n=1 Tax=Streptomyces sp. YIM 132580 TaxID=2691958 RepID=UPI00136BA246|nr:hypothetical protein [Streptomyces sp. YIM 132580]MXG27244.1 hypothetical protein [Streptomyces sp. YIM 132580]